MKRLMNSILYAMFPFLLLAGFGTACKSTSGDGTENAAQREMCAEVLNAIGKNDYSSFQCVCGDLIPEKEFLSAHRSMKQQFGEISGFRHMATLKTPGVQNDIWIVTFRRKNSAGNEDILQDLLFRFVTGEDTDGWKVIGFAFL